MRIIERDTSVYVGKHRGRHIIDTKHSIDRFVDRGRFADRAGKQGFKEKIHWVIENAIDKILDKHGDEEGVYVVHSNSTGIGVVITWREEGDPRLRDGNNHAIIVTVLPVKSRHTASNPGDTMLIVEVRDQIEEYLKENGLFEKNTLLKEAVNEKDGVYSSVTIDGLGFDLLYHDGVLYDMWAVEVMVP